MWFRGVDLGTNGGKVDGLHSSVVHDVHGPCLAGKLTKVWLLQQLGKGQCLRGSPLSNFWRGIPLECLRAVRGSWHCRAVVNLILLLVLRGVRCSQSCLIVALLWTAVYVSCRPLGVVATRACGRQCVSCRKLCVAAITFGGCSWGNGIVHHF